MTSTAATPTNAFDLDLPTLGPEALELSRTQSTEHLRELSSQHRMIRNLMGFVDPRLRRRHQDLGAISDGTTLWQRSQR